jgi:acetylornithine deacetylase/succinyl-diaminopimelate desuccinylase-like protein
MNDLRNRTMSRQGAIARAERHFDSGAFKADLARRVAIPSESQNAQRGPDLRRYLEDEMKPALDALGFACRILTHPKAKGPFLFAERIENPARPTVLGYGHGDVIRGFEGSWQQGRDPWGLDEAGGRYWGRGTADNKGQHTINLAALDAVLAERGHLGFNAKWLIEMGEETGSAGLRELCAENREAFGADVLIASDGPRLAETRPTIYLGCRGAYPIDLWIDAREGGHHSGNWGGLLSNPAVQLVHALSCIVGPTGQIRVPAFVPDEMPPPVRRALADCEVASGPGEPAIDPGWGEPGLTLAQRRKKFGGVDARDEPNLCPRGGSRRDGVDGTVGIAGAHRENFEGAPGVDLLRPRVCHFALVSITFDRHRAVIAQGADDDCIPRKDTTNSPVFAGFVAPLLISAVLALAHPALRSSPSLAQSLSASARSGTRSRAPQSHSPATATRRLSAGILTMGLARPGSSCAVAGIGPSKSWSPAMGWEPHTRAVLSGFQSTATQRLWAALWTAAIQAVRSQVRERLGFTLASMASGLNRVANWSVRAPLEAPVKAGQSHCLPTATPRWWAALPTTYIRPQLRMQRGGGLGIYPQQRRMDPARREANRRRRHRTG